VIDGENYIDYQIETPEGNLTYRVRYNEITNWVTDHMIKNDEDIYLIKKYRPVPKLDKDFVQEKYDELGDDGIVRTVVFGEQPGCWQEGGVNNDIQRENSPYS